MRPIEEKYNKKHLREMARIRKAVEDEYKQALRDLTVAADLAARAGGSGFSFSSTPMLRKQADNAVRKLGSGLMTVIANGIDAEWALSNGKNDALADLILGKGRTGLTPELEARYYNNNHEAREAFKIRRKEGLGLSEKVWRYADQFKDEIETAIDLGLKEGRSADHISQDLRDCLRYPDKLFRRVRDAQGELRLSKPARAFHPGQGVYRSSYMNARRLAVTEGNIAYHTADYTRWQQMDFVVGIRIGLSNNHTCIGVDVDSRGRKIPGARPFHDICDELAGDYPKDFKFTGWHPHCRCHATAILKSQKEMEEDDRRMMDGKKPLGNSTNKIKEPPEQFNDWIRGNEDRIDGSSGQPYFITDNRKLVDNVLNVGRASPPLKPIKLTVKDPDNVTDREIKTMIEEFAKANPGMFNRGLAGVTIKDMRGGFMANSRKYDLITDKYTGSGNIIEISRHTFHPGTPFTPNRDLAGAMGAIVKKKDLTFNQEYALESLWHEFKHSQAVGFITSKAKTTINTASMEVINQFCARESYVDFVKCLGGKVANKKKIMKDGYGYREHVRNLHTLLDGIGVSKNRAYGHFKDMIVQKPYEDIHGELIDYVLKNGGFERKTAKKLVETLGMSEDCYKVMFENIKAKTPAKGVKHVKGA